MTTFIIVASSVLWAASIALLLFRQVAAPAVSYVALFVLSLAKTQLGYPVLPINNIILTGWLCMTVVVTLATLLQPEPVRRQTRGMGYVIAGALTGMAVGLLGSTFTSGISLLYGMMIVATVAGVFFGFLLYSRTPDGRPVNLSSGNFFRYLMAKGFPTAITVMMMGVAIVLAIAVNNVNIA